MIICPLQWNVKSGMLDLNKLQQYYNQCEFLVGGTVLPLPTNFCSEKINLRQVNQTKGLFCQQTIQENEVIIRIPSSLVIGRHNIEKSQVIQQLIQQNPDHSLLKSEFYLQVLFVLLEIENPASAYQTMFKLGEHNPSIMDCEIQLTDKYLGKKIKEQQSELLMISDKFIDILKNHQIYQKISQHIYQKIKHAYKFVLSRRMSIERNLDWTFLVTYADQINHGPNRVSFKLIKKGDSVNDKNELCTKMYNYIIDNLQFLKEEEKMDLNIIQKIFGGVIENDVLSQSLKQIVEYINFKKYQQKPSLAINDLQNFQAKPEKFQEPYEIYQESIQMRQLQENIIKAEVDDDYIKDYYNMEDSESDEYDQIKNTSQVMEQKISKKLKVQHEYEWFLNDEESGEFVVVANQKIYENQQILNDYGSKTNEELLLYYGFSLLDNENEEIRFRIHMNCSDLEEFHQSLENLIFYEYVSIEEMKNEEVNGFQVEELTRVFILNYFQFSYDLYDFVQKYFVMLGQETTNQKQILSFIQAILHILLKKFNQYLKEVQQEQLQIYYHCKINLAQWYLDKIHKKINNQIDIQQVRFFSNLDQLTK